MFPNLDAEMARRKITRAMLAERIHKTPTTLSLKLNGKAPLSRWGERRWDMLQRMPKSTMIEFLTKKKFITVLIARELF